MLIDVKLAQRLKPDQYLWSFNGYKGQCQAMGAIWDDMAEGAISYADDPQILKHRGLYYIVLTDPNASAYL